MSAGTAIASFTDGFFRGREIKHGWQDRADAKKRQEKLDGWQEAREGRAAEEHGWRRDANGRTVADYNRTREEEDHYRDAARRAYEATEDSLGAPPQDAPAGGGSDPQPLTVSTSGQTADPVAGVAQELGLGAVPRRHGTDAFVKARPPESFTEAPVGPRRAEAAPSFEQTGRGNQPVQEQAAQPGPSFEQSGRGNQPVQEPALGKPDVAIAPGWEPVVSPSGEVTFQQTSSTAGTIPPAPGPTAGPGPDFERSGRGDQPMLDVPQPVPSFEQTGRGAQPVELGAPPDPNRGRAVSIPGAGEEYMLHQNGRAYGMSTGQEVTDPNALAMIRERAFQSPEMRPMRPSGPANLSPDQRAASAQTAPATAPAMVDPSFQVDPTRPQGPRSLSPAQRAASEAAQPSVAPAMGGPLPRPDRIPLPEPSREQAQAALAQQPNYAHDFREDGGFRADVREVVARARSMVDKAPVQIAAAAMGDVNSIIDTVNPVARYVADREIGRLPEMGAPRPAGPAESAAGALPVPAATAPGAALAAPAAAPVPSAVPASAPGPTKALAAAGQQAIAENTTPAMKAAGDAAAASMPALGAAGNAPVTEKQRERGSEAFLERYREVGVPIVMKAYLERGDVDKAIAFQEFIDQGNTKAAMKKYAQAAFAVSVGDFDTFGSNMIEIYNDLDYFPDGTVIVPGKSGYTDAEGNIVTHASGRAVGGVLTMQDETGKEFQQVFQSTEDMVQAGAMLTPENAFEWLQKKAAAEAEAALGAKKEGKEEAKEGKKDARSREKEINEAAMTLLKETKDIMGNPTMTLEEAKRQVTEQLYPDEAAQLLPQFPPAAVAPVLPRPAG